MSYRLSFVVLGLLHLQHSVGRKAPVLILNEGQQCYFNAGLQCLFATKSFPPWIKDLDIAKCVNKKNSELVSNLKEVSVKYESTPFTEWPTNITIFNALEKISKSTEKIAKKTQYDVLTVVEKILERLPKDCNNPFIIKGSLIIDGEPQSDISLLPLGTNLAVMKDPSIIGAFNKMFNSFEIQKYPTILCIALDGNQTNIEIPQMVFMEQNGKLNNKKGSYQYNLEGVAWRVGEKKTSGHYFATVKYQEIWYIVDDAWRYGPGKYDITSPVPLNALKILQVPSEFTWMYQRRAHKEFIEWLKNGQFKVTTDPTKKSLSQVNPVLLVYERELTELEEKEKKESVATPSKALSESLEQLNQSLATLSALIK